MLTLATVSRVSGAPGDFEVTLDRQPRYVDTDKCIACGLCSEKCPRKVDNAYDAGLSKRKAVYVQYAQAVPLKYAIDPEQCIYLIRGKCRACEKFCPTGAIAFDDRPRQRTLNVGAIVLTAGNRVYDPAVYDTFGYGRSADIVTSLEFERMLSASGPYGGHLVRPSNRSQPRKIAWIQCVGSRDSHHGARGYCSAVCCTYAVKEAILAKEHSAEGLDAAIFYIDIRTFGKDFERYYNQARDRGVRFIKSRISRVEPADADTGHAIVYVDENGRTVTEGFDIVVLSLGLEVGARALELAETLGVEVGAYGYVKTDSLDPVRTSKPGIYACGTLQAPKDIPSSVIDASAAAARAGTDLAEARWTRTLEAEKPPEIDFRGEPARIGVFVCCCGTNIAGFVDVPQVVEFARTLPNVAYAEENLFSCSQDTQGHITDVIREQRLNRVVVSACTPKTHEPLFQETLVNAGLNKYLFEMANIRNQCSWVHQSDKAEATAKAKDLVRMAVTKAALIEPLTEPKMKINQAALVIGGGVAGMVAALTLADQGYRTYLVESSERLGGQALNLTATWQGADIGAYVRRLIGQVDAHSKIEVLSGARLENVEGFIGNFKTTVAGGGDPRTIEHGVAIVATGAGEYKPEDYLYGTDPRVVTGLELQRRLKDGRGIENVQGAVFIQCVGSRCEHRPYCSKVCCTLSVQSALALKKSRPDMETCVLYRDLRTYGLREDLYRRARDAGVKFIRYDNRTGVEVAADTDRLSITIRDRVLRRRMLIHSDLLVLASAIVPHGDNQLARLFKIPQNDDGFFAEAHVKLRPNDFATDGVFVCGLAHAPKPIDESIAQAQAAASRAVTVLAALEVAVSGTVALVDPAMCSRCGVCVAVCPYTAPAFNAKTGKAEIQATLCKGCGLCVASCRSGAIHLKGFDTSQIMAMISSCMAEMISFEETFS